MAIPAHRTGFTLIEIMISIMIFIVVSAAMIGILMVATELFRRGESSRAANDETVAVIGTIEDDLKHLVPAADSGWLFARILPDGTGNALLAFVIANPDPSTIGANGDNARQLVAYWATNDQLHRGSAPLRFDPADLVPGQRAKDKFLDDISANGLADDRIITTGCLHFGISLLNLGLAGVTIPRLPAGASGPSSTSGLIDWDNTLSSGASFFPPSLASGEYDTDVVMQPGPPPVNWPYPNAMRIALVLTGGGRFAPKGEVIDDGGGTLRISGIGALATTPGAMLRVESPSSGSGTRNVEWIAYSQYRDGLVTTERRGTRNTVVATHARGDIVRVGQTYSIVRSFPQ